MSGSVILAYHSLDRSGSVISVTPELFERQMEHLAAGGSAVVPLADVRTAEHAVALTFDDAFANFVDFALPVLEKFRLPATVFAVAGYCGKRNEWPSQPAGIPRMPLMNWDDLRRLPASGITVGAHTVTHPDLAPATREQARAELRGARVALEDRLARPVREFAYPYGRVTDPVKRLARFEFDLACGTAPAFLSPRSDSWNLPRIDAYYLRRPAVFENLFHPFGKGYVALRRAARGLRALAAA